MIDLALHSEFRPAWGSKSVFDVQDEYTRKTSAMEPLPWQSLPLLLLAYLRRGLCRWLLQLQVG